MHEQHSPHKMKHKYLENEDVNDIEQTLQNTNITLCKFGCGRSIAPGTTKRGNPFDTCCRDCAVSKGTSSTHDSACIARNPQFNTNDNDNDEDVEVGDAEKKNDQDEELSIGELYDNSYGDEPDYRSSLIWEIHSKDNWEKKIYDEAITAKWKKESATYGMSASQFDSTIDIMKKMLLKGKLLTKRGKNQYYSSDSDTSVQTAESVNPINSGVIQQEEAECIGKTLGDELRVYVRQQMEGKLKEEEKDWHPGTNKMVLDLVHPSLYCYVADESVLADSTLDDKVKQFISAQNTAMNQKQKQRHWFWRGNNNNSNDPKPTMSEQHMYQWLPSEFRIVRGSDGWSVDNVKIESYINNLERAEHAKLYGIIERVFGKMVPLFDEAMGKLPERCQVIVKMANILLDKDDKERTEYGGGSWHIEGMEYEHIGCSGIYYYDVDNIKGSYLQFRRAIDEEDVNYEQGDTIGVFEEYGLRDEDPLNEYLGKVAIDKEQCIVFPNTFQHRVTKFKLKDKTKNGIRKILVFFVIDPDHRIISTKHVPFQQKQVMRNYLQKVLGKQIIEVIPQMITEFMPCFDMKTARKNREKLMFVRKYAVNEQNEEIYEMPFSLCEH